MGRTVSAAIGLLLTFSAMGISQTEPSLKEVMARYWIDAAKTVQGVESRIVPPPVSQ